MTFNEFIVSDIYKEMKRKEEGEKKDSTKLIDTFEPTPKKRSIQISIKR